VKDQETGRQQYLFCTADDGDIDKTALVVCGQLSGSGLQCVQVHCSILILKSDHRLDGLSYGV
jgi:hypothetical protein